LNANRTNAKAHAVCRLFAWTSAMVMDQLVGESLHIAADIYARGENFERLMVQATPQHLAAMRMMFAWPVTGQVVAANPARTVRRPKHVRTGMATVPDTEQAPKLLNSTDTSMVVGLGD
jgi:site-specific recombinase XerC